MIKQSESTAEPCILNSLLLNRCDATGARQIAEAMRAAVAQQVVRYGHEEFQVTVR